VKRTANVAYVDGHVTPERVRFFPVRPNNASPLADREQWAVGDIDADNDPATIEAFKTWAQ
jgi:prepilin-type processing-associated H-X9-DG protein